MIPQNQTIKTIQISNFNFTREQMTQHFNTQLINEIGQNGNIIKIKLLLQQGANINCIYPKIRSYGDQPTYYPLQIALEAQINYDHHNDNDNDHSNSNSNSNINSNINDKNMNYGQSNIKRQMNKFENINKNSTSEIKYLQIIQFLLKNGADPNFNQLNDFGGYKKRPIVDNLIKYLTKLKSEQNRIKFIQIFMQNGVNLLNQKLLFDVVALNNQRNRMKQLAKMSQSFDFEQYAQQREKHLFDKYCQFYGLQNQQYEMYIKQDRQRRNNYFTQKVEQNPKIHFDLIKLILINGKCPNAAKKQYQNFNLKQKTQRNNSIINQYGELSFNLQQLLQQNTIHIERGIKISIETVLHRSIMNNCIQLVQLLIQNGADPNIKCVCPYREPVYPHQWDVQIREKKVMECKGEEKLIKLEKQRDFLMKNMKQIDFDSQQKPRRWKSILQLQLELNVCNFQIFKAQCSDIENWLPQYTYLSSHVSCLQLAQMFNVSKQIVELLQKSLQQLQKQKYNQKQGCPQNFEIKGQQIVRQRYNFQ